ncbi:CHAT domain-containing tetratricopeptide repeat protein [uncultured Tenacibaculum sp.]|uniref:CHAT domain-containing protein n=1 Tax=uncultured Tenacibaculum sp. TaxID=174713 RepID=UPI0026322136|nr:CHAT domain-containing tetratricopeptide repeat protein [uncultured Tenacibaculum sp.]
MHILKKRKRLLKLCFLLLSTCVFNFHVCSQQLSQYEFDSILNIERINSSQKITLLKRKLKNSEKQQETAKLYYKTAVYCWNKKKQFSWALKEGIYFLKQEQLIRNILESKKTSLIERNLFNLGLFYKELKDYTNAISYLDELISYIKTPNKQLAKCYKLKGNIYTNLGDFERANNNLNKAKQIFKKLNLEGQLFKVNNDLLKLLIDKKDKNSFPVYQKISKENEKLITKFPKTSFKYRFDFLYNSASILYNHKFYKRSIPWYKDALKVLLHTKDSVRLANFHNNFSLVFLKVSEPDSAKFYCKKGLTYTNSKNVLEESALYDNLGDIYLSESKFDKAFFYYDKAIQTISSDNSNEFSITIYFKDLLGYHLDKLNALITFYEAKQDPSVLNKAYELLIKIDSQFDTIYYTSKERISKLFWRKKGRDFYINAVKICYRLNKLKEVFYYVEKSKGMLLLENTNNQFAKKLANLSDTLIQKEDSLQKRILSFKEQINNTPKAALNDSLFLAKEAYFNFLNILENKNVNYYRYKTNIPITTIKAIRKNLRNDEVAISYILGDNSGYVLIISKNEYEVLPIKHYKTLVSLVNEYKKLCLSPIQYKAELNRFKDVSNRLYQILFPKEFEAYFKRYNKYSIVTDGILNTISFDALIPFVKEDSSFKYLIEEKEIVYHNSLSLTLLNNTLKTPFFKTQYNFIINNFKDSSFTSLTTKKEPFFNDKMFTDKQVSKKNFIKEFKEASSVFISSHAKGTNNIPWIALYDQKLYLNELFFLNSPKNFVVLDACETGVGKLQTGEGSYNLTRGFLNAGAKSVLAAQWQVNEKYNTEILKTFFKALKKGNSKSTSLAFAKRAYLKKHENTNLNSPYYWAVTTITGNDSPLPFNYNYTILITVLVILVILYVLRYLNKRID